jgi:hypothetical protein
MLQLFAVPPAKISNPHWSSCMMVPLHTEVKLHVITRKNNSQVSGSAEVAHSRYHTTELLFAVVCKGYGVCYKGDGTSESEDMNQGYHCNS